MKLVHTPNCQISTSDTSQDKDETPESKLALANINQIVDRMIDAYARAVALAGSRREVHRAEEGLERESDHLVQVSQW